MSEQELIPIETVAAVEAFTGGTLRDLLVKIREQAKAFVPDVETEEGRKHIASVAYKVSRSKTAIDDAGKAFVADWKAQSAKVDALRKIARDSLDQLRDEVRAPLTQWEAEREAEEQAERDRIRAEQEAREQLERDRLEAQRRELQEQAEALEARERLLRQAEQEQASRLAQEKREAEASAERQRAEAEAAERARRDQESALEAERVRIQRARQDEEARAAAEQKAREQDIEHRRRINGEAAAALLVAGFTEQQAKRIVIAVASGSIPNIRIAY